MDNQKKEQDSGGVPRVLTPEGYRSLSRSVGITAAAGISLVIGGVMWSLVSHQQASAAQIADQPANYQVAQRVELPAPTPTPFQSVPQIRPSLFHATPHATMVAKTNPIQPDQSYRAQQTAQYQPPPQSYQMPPMQPTQPVVDEHVRRIAEARYASSAVNLDTGDNDSQSTSAAQNGNRSDSIDSQGSSSVDHDGTIGYVPHKSRYGLSEGTIIRARLITSIDSTIPGGIVEGIVVENVFDSRAHTVVVIPQGTTVIGSTEQTQSGQARLVVVLKRFHFPNGQDFNVGESEGAGLRGENGMPVSVDTHAGKAFGSAFVGAALQAGVNLASRASTFNISTGGNQNQPQQLPPTMHANPGQPFDIILTRDEPFDRYVEN